MDAKAAIKVALDTAEMISMAYLEDLTDEEMLIRPVPQANHINWQVGHLIASEHQMISKSVPNSMPELPAGFADRYASETASQDDASQFLRKADLIAEYRRQRAATLIALEKMTPETLDQETDESIRSYAPTVGAAFVLQDAHWMMHAGQWAVVRRKLGRKPIF
ncbi:MAG: DinB family protein [Planctomycetota bacterium]